jgi:membrane-associated phospholipid phosphatase
MGARVSVAVVVVSLSAAAPLAAQDRSPSPPPSQGSAAAPQAQAPAPSPSPSSSSSSKPDTTVAPTFANLFPTIGRDILRLPSTGTFVTLGIGGALSLAVSPADEHLTEQASLEENIGDDFGVGGWGGNGYVQVGTAFATLIIGHATHKPRVQALGFDLARAQVVNSILTQGLKVVVDRKRPDGSSYSFPSGHSSASFATATVLQQHFGWKVGVPAYAAATYIGGTRLSKNHHYASDVLFGAALGIVAGRTVTIGHGAQRFAVAPTAVPGGGVGVTLTKVGGEH